MKIIEVTHRFVPNIGGVENHVYNIAKRFEDPVTAYSCDLDKNLKNKETIDGIKVIRTTSFSPSNSYFFSLNLYYLLKKENCDVLHVHNASAFPAFIAFYAMKGKYKNLFFTPHFHMSSSSPFRRFFKKIYNPILKKLFTESDKIFCVSEYEKKQLTKKFKINPDKLIVLHNGINIDLLKQAKPYSSHEKIVLYVGRLEKYKNIQYLIGAMKYLKDYELKIIGSGIYEDNLRKISGKNIEILTGLSDEEVARWYKTCSVFVTLSDIESFGLTVVEALAAGKPVVVNDATALTEFANKFGCVKKVNIHKINVEELAGLIKETSQIKVRNVDLSEYDWNKIVKKIKNEITK